MKLYYAPGTCALACWIALEWAKADYTVERVNLHDLAYQQINPLGMVPALDIQTGRAMTQANAILQFIVDSHPEADLGSNASAYDRFEFNETMAFLTGDFHPAFWPFFAPARYTTLKGKEAMEAAQEASYARIDRVMSFLDKLIGDTVHVYQNKRTVADAYAFVMASWSVKTPQTWRNYPNVARFMENMLEDPAVQKVMTLSKQAN